MLCCLKKWLWFRQEGREELVLGLEVDMVLGGQGLDRELELLGLELVLVLGQGLQAQVLGLWLVLVLVLALDLEQEVEELELVLLDHFQGLGLDWLALGQLEEPWVLLPPLELWASLELSKLDYHNRPL